MDASMPVSSAATGISQGGWGEAKGKHWRVHHTAMLQTTAFSHLVSLGEGSQDRSARLAGTSFSTS